MHAIQVGKKYVKTKGRKAGETVEVTKVLDKNYAEVKDSKGKAKRCNFLHLEKVA